MFVVIVIEILFLIDLSVGSLHGLELGLPLQGIKLDPMFFLCQLVFLLFKFRDPE